MSEKVRENRLRRMAQRQGLRLEKSRRRDEHALDYGCYALIDASRNAIYYGTDNSGLYRASLNDIEDMLVKGPRK